MIDIIVPTFKRIANIQKCFDNISQFKDCSPLFVVHESDEDSLNEVKRLSAKYTIDKQSPSGVNASNAGYWAVKTNWFVLSQDDIIFHKGWLDNAKKHISKGIKVIGLYDGYPYHLQSQHSVSWLINKNYVQRNSLSIGHKNVLFNPDYKKNYADNELNDTAKFRGVWAYASDSLAEHLHPGFNKSPMDSTYQMNENFLGDDRGLYNSRIHLWTKES
jgi:glycosyltransferase involved in cell wall biosynthesis